MKDPGGWIALLCALVSCTWIPWLLRQAKSLLTGESAAQGKLLGAEARKTNAESDDLIITRLYAEIERLDRERAAQDDKIAAQDEKIAELKKLDDERTDREAGLKRENEQLRTKVRRLEDRITGLEKIFKIGPVPPDMQAALDKLKDVE